MEEKIKDWTQYIVPRVNQNTNTDGQIDPSLNTTDMVTVPSQDEMQKLGLEYQHISLTDFALANNGHIGNVLETSRGRIRVPSQLALRSTSDDRYNTNIDVQNWFPGVNNSTAVYKNNLGVPFIISLQLPMQMSLQDIEREIGPVREVHDGEKTYYTLNIGEYPKSIVDNDTESKLDSAFHYGDLRNGIQCTGRLWTTQGRPDHPMVPGEGKFLSKQNPEFILDGQKYVRTHVWGKQVSSQYTYENGTIMPDSGTAQWFKVEPITMRVMNWEDYAAGKTNRLDLYSGEVMVNGISFFPNLRDNNCTLWQNSLLRAYLNSADSRELDGNPNYKTEQQWDFRKTGFLYQAFNMTREATRVYTIPDSEDEIATNAFAGCVGLEKIIVPSHVTKINDQAFHFAPHTQVYLHPNRNLGWNVHGTHTNMNWQHLYLSKDGQTLVLSQYEDATLSQDYYKIKIEHANLFNHTLEKFLDANYRENNAQLQNWRAEKKIKFIPPEFTLKVFPSTEMQNYFVNNNQKRWAELVKTLGFDALPDMTEKNNSLTDLMKIYYALGGFSDNQGESERALDYVLKYVAVTENPNATPSEIGNEVHRRFSKLELNGPYNPTFAKFFMKYYHENPDFMTFSLTNTNGYKLLPQDYLCTAHNRFANILKNYPNRVVNGNEERALLSPQFVAECCLQIQYNNVEAENEALAVLIGRYGYSQEQFNEIQKIYDRAKQMKDGGVIQAEATQDNQPITFRVLEKDNPLGFVIGDITNCCQYIGGAGESCVTDGYLNPNAGFMVFEKQSKDEQGHPTGEKHLLGQAYVWYDPETKTVCYDNIEIPTKVIDELKKGNKHGDELSMHALLDAVIRSADAVIDTMNQNGVAVQRVTVGKGYNDLGTELQGKFGAPEKHPKAKHRGYTGYTDADGAQYVIRDDTKVKLNTLNISNSAQDMKTNPHAVENFHNV